MVTVPLLRRPRAEPVRRRGHTSYRIVPIKIHTRDGFGGDRRRAIHKPLVSVLRHIPIGIIPSGQRSERWWFRYRCLD